MLKQFTIIIFAILLIACGQERNINMEGPDLPPPPIKYLALGDSYTIGESVPVADRWPVKLVKLLQEDSVVIEQPKIIAQTGWTTDELKAAIDQENITETYGLVSLLIGVNNQYRGEARGGYTAEGYKKEFTELLEMSIGFAGDQPEKVFVVSIPDYGVTPFAANSDTAKIRMELEEYNAIAKEICEQKKVVFCDITPISIEAKEDLELVASDKLHPSGKMYDRWVREVILERVRSKVN